MSTGARAVIGAVAIAVAVILFVVLQGSDDDADSPTTAATSTTTEPATVENSLQPQKPEKPEKPEIPTIVIKGGEPVGGVAELEYEKGDEIEFFVDSDVADHVHLHGYNVFQDVTPSEPIKFSVPATLEGVYEVELEDRVVPIAEITVNPS
jgi:hypothetical protein